MKLPKEVEDQIEGLRHFMGGFSARQMAAYLLAEVCKDCHKDRIYCACECGHEDGDTETRAEYLHRKAQREGAGR